MSIVWVTIFAALSSFLVTVWLVGWLARSPTARVALDQPNERSLHSVPVPRTGGIGVVAGVASGWLVVNSKLPWIFWCAIALVFTVSILDDYLKRGLSPWVRLGVHLLAGGLVAFSSLLPLHSPAFALVVALAICWMCNLYNFMDGSDGLAGGMALMGFSCYSIAAWWAQYTSFALLNIVVAAAAAGFLVHNFHPARIFLGDAGSIPLGFLAAVFGMTGWLQHVWPWWFPLLVFSPFVVDASVTLSRRAWARAPVWKAHRDHYYQRLVQMGWGHRRTALAEYSLMCLCGGGALASLTWSPAGQALLLITTTAIYVVLITLVELAWRRTQSASSHEL